MTSSLTTEKVIPCALLGMTAVTGLVDAVSFLSLGHVFTANMTGNIVFLAFATAHVSGLSIALLVNGAVGFSCRGDTGRADHGAVGCRFTDSICGTSVPPGGGFSVRCVVLRYRIPRRFARTLFSTARSDRLDGVRDGYTECRYPETRNPGSDDNGPDINDYGHRRRLFARERQQPETGEKGCGGRRNVLGGRRWVQSSYTTRSQRPCGLRPQSPPCAVSCYFAPGRRPISADRRDSTLCVHAPGIFPVNCGPSICQFGRLSFFKSAANRGSLCKPFTRGPMFVKIKPS
jgi:hypothetical protein